MRFCGRLRRREQLLAADEKYPLRLTRSQVTTAGRHHEPARTSHGVDGGEVTFVGSWLEISTDRRTRVLSLVQTTCQRIEGSKVSLSRVHTSWSSRRGQSRCRGNDRIVIEGRRGEKLITLSDMLDDWLRIDFAQYLEGRGGDLRIYIHPKGRVESHLDTPSV